MAPYLGMALQTMEKSPSSLPVTETVHCMPITILISWSKSDSHTYMFRRLPRRNTMCQSLPHDCMCSTEFCQMRWEEKWHVHRPVCALKGHRRILLCLFSLSCWLECRWSSEQLGFVDRDKSLEMLRMCLRRSDNGPWLPRDLWLPAAWEAYTFRKKQNNFSLV